MPLVDGSRIKDLVALPVGWYDATFDKYELKRSGNENDYDACEFVIAAEDSPDGDEHRLFYNMTVTEKTMWRWKRDALALGAPADVFEGEFDTEEVLDELVGNPCRIQVDVQKSGEYAGRNQVKAIKGPQLDVDSADDEIEDN